MFLRFLQRKGTLSKMHRAATDITELYAPQFDQFGLELSGKGAVFTGEVANDRAHGRAWIMPLSPTCIVIEHFITPTHDMYLAEYTPEPYACVSEVSAPTLTCMPEAGNAREPQTIAWTVAKQRRLQLYPK